MNCLKVKNMDNNKTISYIAFESVTARQERTIKRLWILCLILIISLIGSNAGWVWYEKEYEDVITVEQDADWKDGNVILNGTGEVVFNEQNTPKNH